MRGTQEPTPRAGDTQRAEPETNYSLAPVRGNVA